MRYMILLAVLLMCLPVSGEAWQVVGGEAAPPSSRLYIGWDNTGGVPSTDPTSYAGAVNTLVLTKWTPSNAGTLETIRGYIYKRTPTIYHESLNVYKSIAGTVTWIATATYTGVDAAWTDELTLVAVSGQSLAYNSGDELYFGGVASSNNVYSWGRADTGGTGMYYPAAGDFSTGPPATVSLSLSAGRKMGFILGYSQ